MGFNPNLYEYSKASAIVFILDAQKEYLEKKEALNRDDSPFNDTEREIMFSLNDIQEKMLSLDEEYPNQHSNFCELIKKLQDIIISPKGLINVYPDKFKTK